MRKFLFNSTLNTYTYPYHLAALRQSTISFLSDGSLGRTGQNVYEKYGRGGAVKAIEYAKRKTRKLFI
jgi:hypothetical protein